MTTYETFIASKRVSDRSTGLAVVPTLNPMLFDWQQAIVRWALRRGRAALFEDCGLGKTAQQLEWANHVPGRVIIVAPLAVGPQTEREAAKFGIDAKYMRQDDPKQRIVITNYEMLDRFAPDNFTGIVLDESSILKSYTGKFRTYIIDEWGSVQFRLACTATPAPNDYMELGNHSEFLGVMSRAEMLSMFFVHDGSETQQWRLKGHAEGDFWRWMCSWSIMIRKPSDIGYPDGEFTLPPLTFHERIVEDTQASHEFLFQLQASTLDERLAARRRTSSARCQAAAEIANGKNGDAVILWCNLNDESAQLTRMVKGAVEVKGSDGTEDKEQRMLGFTTGDINRLVTKPSIAGFGMNWQHCNNVVFVGLNDSYEQFYQALRRCWRFGQKRPVNCYIVTANTEGAVAANIKRKERDAERMHNEMVQHMADISTQEIRSASRTVTRYTPKQSLRLPSFV
jgi:superfamily II DNA or RNA helicase